MVYGKPKRKASADAEQPVESPGVLKELDGIADVVTAFFGLVADGICSEVVDENELALVRKSMEKSNEKSKSRSTPPRRSRSRSRSKSPVRSQTNEEKSTTEKSTMEKSTMDTSDRAVCGGTRKTGQHVSYFTPNNLSPRDWLLIHGIKPADQGSSFDDNYDDREGMPHRDGELPPYHENRREGIPHQIRAEIPANLETFYENEGLGEGVSSPRPRSGHSRGRSASRSRSSPRSGHSRGRSASQSKSRPRSGHSRGRSASRSRPKARSGHSRGRTADRSTDGARSRSRHHSYGRSHSPPRSRSRSRPRGQSSQQHAVPPRSPSRSQHARTSRSARVKRSRRVPRKGQSKSPFPFLSKKKQLKSHQPRNETESDAPGIVEWPNM
mmetsp:Transcript_12594/g.23539  ORF Transcript_12594/g.23539 Transcript_12594/m.23539 type:complete len:383 (-) Transcript_12594:119-1267(-)